MNKNKKFGFTLVELLAVIVILAVVILIAVTAVVPRMNNAKKKAFVDEALVYVKAAKEAYVTDPSTECYNISDMGNLVKQTKDGYSGTVFVNEKGVSLNLTNGKYYLKTNATPTEYDIVETTPSKYVSTCSDNTNYTITYDLNGGTPSGTNPSSYKPSTGTDIFYNPTKSGYRFVGWSTKNIFDYKDVLANNESYVELVELNGRRAIRYKMNQNGPSVHMLEGKFKENTRYTISGFGASSKEGSFGLRVKYEDSNQDVYVGNANEFKSFSATTKSSKTVIRLSGWYSANQWVYIDIDTFQIEEGTAQTDYQEFMEPTMNVKVYKGETGNKTFVANWEAL